MLTIESAYWPYLKTALWLIGIPALAYAILCAYVYSIQDRLIYYPVNEIYATPTDIDLAYEDVRLDVAPRIRLDGWYVPRSGAQFTLLFMHGNAGNISHRLESIRQFHELGLNVFVFDYRGYGRSTGRPDEQGLYADGRAAYDYLVADRKIPANRIILFGRSLGAAVALRLARDTPAAAVVTEAAFYSAVRIGQEAYPYLPVSLLARHRFENYRAITSRKHPMPLLMIHSEADEIVPPEHARELFALAAAPSELHWIHGGHNDAYVESDAEYRRIFSELLRRLETE
ncbi:MAG: alpha/beta hydrolase [Leptospiraceae bacterium]|nr:alpha/beta hydrolase [Leptospiraceae bacterium]